MLLAVALAIMADRVENYRPIEDWPVSERLVREIVSIQRGNDHKLLQTASDLADLRKPRLARIAFDAVDESYPDAFKREWRREQGRYPTILGDVFGDEAEPLPTLIARAVASQSEGDVQRALNFIRTQAERGRPVDISGYLNLRYRDRNDAALHLCYLLFDDEAENLAYDVALTLNNGSLREFVSSIAGEYFPGFGDFLVAVLSQRPSAFQASRLLDMSAYPAPASLLRGAALEHFRDTSAQAHTLKKLDVTWRLVDRLVESGELDIARQLALYELPTIAENLASGNELIAFSPGPALGKLGLREEAESLAKIIERRYFTTRREPTMENAGPILRLADLYLGAGEYEMADSIIIDSAPSNTEPGLADAFRRFQELVFDRYSFLLIAHGLCDQSIRFCADNNTRFLAIVTDGSAFRSLEDGDLDRAKRLIELGVQEMRSADELDISWIVDEMLELGMDELLSELAHEQYGTDPSLHRSYRVLSGATVYAKLNEVDLAMKFFEYAFPYLDLEDLTIDMSWWVSDGQTAEDFAYFADSRLLDLACRSTWQLRSQKPDGIQGVEWIIDVLRECQDDPDIVNKLVPQFVAALPSPSSHNRSIGEAYVLTSLFQKPDTSGPPLSIELQERILNEVVSSRAPFD